jgi:acyl carrier protein
VDKSSTQLMSPGVQMNEAELELAQMIITTLDLDLRAEDIAPEAPLFGDGLGLDSIDVLEVALAVSRRYGVKLRSDDEASERIFRCLRSLNQHIQEHRTR